MRMWSRSRRRGLVAGALWLTTALLGGAATAQPAAPSGPPPSGPPPSKPAPSEPASGAAKAQSRQISGVAHMWMGARLRVKLTGKDTLGSGVIFGFDGATSVTRDGAKASRQAILPGDRVQADLRKGPTGWVAVRVQATATSESGKGQAKADPFGGDPGFAGGEGGGAPGAGQPNARPDPSKPASKTAPPAGDGLAGALGELGGAGDATAPKNTQPKRQATHREKVDALIAVCSRGSTRHSSGCEKLRAACRARAWRGDMRRICPAIGVQRSGSGSSGSSRASATPSYVTSKYRKLASACHKIPRHKTCRRLRTVCRRNYRNTSGQARWLCNQLGVGRRSGGGGSSGGGKRAPAKPMDPAFGGFGLSITQAALGDRQPRLWGGHMSLGTMPRRGILAWNIEMDIAKGADGWFWDGAYTFGLGRVMRRRFGLRLTTGIRGSGWTNGRLGTALSVPVEIAFRLYPTRSIALQVSARPSWQVAGAVSRKKGSSSLSFADELCITAGVVWGRRTTRALEMGLYVGARYQEIAGGRFMGVVLGVGYINKL